MEDPSSPGVPPIAVLYKDVKDAADLSERLKGVYKWGSAYEQSEN